jgi:Ca2+-transporting ATPase
MMANNNLYYEELTYSASKVAHGMAVDECLHSMMVSQSEGLSDYEAGVRLQRFGANALAAPPATPLWKLILNQFDDKLVQILLGVAVLSAVLASFEDDLHAFAEPVIILSILIINAYVGVYHSKSAEDSLEALKLLQPETATVLREGKWLGEFPATNLVPGDIIKLRVGDKVPADARIVALKTTTFSTDEGSLTGESVTVQKSLAPVDPDSKISGKVNMVFSGTLVTTGACLAVITRTGMSTEMGAINEGVQSAKDANAQCKTPLAEKLDDFGDQLTKIVMLICVSIWIANIPKFSSSMFTSKLQGAVYHAKVAVALGVAAIPEGLPAVITLCLSLGTGRMAKKNVIVRKLPSVETLGCTSVICTDKTGTLTTNKMVVKSIISFFKTGSKEDVKYINERKVEGISYEPLGEITDFDVAFMHGKGLQDFATICALCNEAQLEYKDGEFDRIGEPTEAALKVLVEKMGSYEKKRSVDPHAMVRQFNDHWSAKYKRLATLEFNRDRKSMSVLCRPISERVYDGSHEKSKIKNKLFVKGAAELVVKRCDRIKLEDGTIIPMDSKIRAQVEAKMRDMARKPLRLIACAYSSTDVMKPLQDITSAEEAAENAALRDSSKFEKYESNMVLVGVCGIKDPARPEVADAIDRCHTAGVRVMMITGW